MKSSGWIPEPGKAAYAVLLVLLSALLLFVTFFNLGNEPIREFDESRHGVSAYEMLQTGEPVVTTYNYEPDYWNLKPPLSEYFIALGYRIFGYNALGFRFFSGFFWILLAAGYTAFACRRMGKKASLFVLFLFSAMERMFIMDHGPRTGDADAYFLLFAGYTLLMLLCYEGKKDRYLYGACLCFSLAFLCKSWHAGSLAVVIAAAELIWDRDIFRNPKKILLCLGCALGPAGIWALFRFLKDGTAFFTAMFQVDFVERSTTIMEDHGGGLFYYLRYLAQDRTVLAIGGLMLLAAVTGIRERKFLKSYRIGVGFLFAAVHLLLFSVVRTKLYWYIWEVYLALILPAGEAFRELTGRKDLLWIRIPAVTAVCCVLALGCAGIIRKETGQLPTQMESDFMNRMAIGENLKGRRIYRTTDERWPQNELLLMEWSGDFRCSAGGADAWRADPEGLLLAENEDTAAFPEGIPAAEGTACTILEHRDPPKEQ